MATNNYEINYDDQRFKAVEAEKSNALSDVEKTYSGMINQSDSYYQKQIDAAQDWEKKQTQLQNEQTNFAIEEINQQKEQARKDYLKEQSASYVDWQKQSNEYGANAEAIAQQGMNLTGYSESSQVSMYNTYQNRVATARESYNQAVLNYNNAITEARLQNNSALAEIAYQSLQTQLELSLAGFQYKNTLVLDQMDKKLQVDEMYYGRWQDVLDQMNTENSMAEQIRQYNESLAEDIRQYNESLAENKRQHDESLAEDKRQFDASLAEDIRQFDLEYALKTGAAGGGGGYSGGTPTSPSGPPSIEKSEPIDMSEINALGIYVTTPRNLVALEKTGAVETIKNEDGEVVKVVPSTSTKISHQTAAQKATTKEKKLDPAKPTPAQTPAKTTTSGVKDVDYWTKYYSAKKYY